MQKLGIFHHQPTEQGDVQYLQMSDMESLAKFPQASPARTQYGKNSFSWNHLMGQVMRDAKPSTQHPPNTTDPVVKAAHDFHELRHREKKNKGSVFIFPNQGGHKTSFFKFPDFSLIFR